MRVIPPVIPSPFEPARGTGRFEPMAFTLPPLPYAVDALSPHMSAETLEFHHGKHHKAYVDTANDLTDGERSDAELEDVILEADGKLFNQTAQIWNHSFFWQCLSPNGGGAPGGELAEAINGAFGSLDGFRDEFTQAAKGHFGSGWAWLVHDGSGLSVTSTHDADLPLKHGQKALLTLDVWEHAYYIDFRNARPDYISTFLDHLVNWEFVAKNLSEV
jgi:superoxide dismutase, Fe-Mn family